MSVHFLNKRADQLPCFLKTLLLFFYSILPAPRFQTHRHLHICKRGARFRSLLTDFLALLYCSTSSCDTHKMHEDRHWHQVPFSGWCSVVNPGLNLHIKCQMWRQIWHLHGWKIIFNVRGSSAVLNSPCLHRSGYMMACLHPCTFSWSPGTVGRLQPLLRWWGQSWGPLLSHYLHSSSTEQYLQCLLPALLLSIKI